MCVYFLVDVSKQLQNCVRDGLLHVKKNKSKHGVEQEGYKLPDLKEVTVKI